MYVGMLIVVVVEGIVVGTVVGMLVAAVVVGVYVRCILMIDNISLNVRVVCIIN